MPYDDREALIGRMTETGEEAVFRARADAMSPTPTQDWQDGDIEEVRMAAALAVAEPVIRAEEREKWEPALAEQLEALPGRLEAARREERERCVRLIHQRALCDPNGRWVLSEELQGIVDAIREGAQREPKTGDPGYPDMGPAPKSREELLLHLEEGIHEPFHMDVIREGAPPTARYHPTAEDQAALDSALRRAAKPVAQPEAPTKKLYDREVALAVAESVVRAEERERCARIALDTPLHLGITSVWGADPREMAVVPCVREEIAAAIREGAQPEAPADYIGDRDVGFMPNETDEERIAYWKQRAEAAEARVTELSEALRPFAEVAEDWPEYSAYVRLVFDEYHGQEAGDVVVAETDMPKEDWERARAALSPPAQQEPKLPDPDLSWMEGFDG